MVATGFLIAGAILVIVGAVNYWRQREGSNISAWDAISSVGFIIGGVIVFFTALTAVTN